MKVLLLELLISLIKSEMLEDIILYFIKTLVGREDSEVDQLKGDDMSRAINTAKAQASIKRKQ